MSVILTTMDEAIIPKKRDCETPAEVKPDASIAFGYCANERIYMVGCS